MIDGDRIGGTCKGKGHATRCKVMVLGVVIAVVPGYDEQVGGWEAKTGNLDWSMSMDSPLSLRSSRLGSSCPGQDHVSGLIRDVDKAVFPGGPYCTLLCTGAKKAMGKKGRGAIWSGGLRPVVGR